MKYGIPKNALNKLNFVFSTNVLALYGESLPFIQYFLKVTLALKSKKHTL